MLTLRREQRRALRRVRLEAFERRLVDLVRLDWAAEHGASSHEEARARVRACWRKAVGYGLETERQIYRFVNLCCFLGWDFESDPRHRWVVEELSSAADDPDRAFSRIGRRLAWQAEIMEEPGA